MGPDLKTHSDSEKHNHCWVKESCTCNRKSTVYSPNATAYIMHAKVSSFDGPSIKGWSEDPIDLIDCWRKDIVFLIAGTFKHHFGCDVDIAGRGTINTGIPGGNSQKIYMVR